jgi:hypothetical protein
MKFQNRGFARHGVQQDEMGGSCEELTFEHWSALPYRGIERAGDRQKASDRGRRQRTGNQWKDDVFQG